MTTEVNQIRLQQGDNHRINLIINSSYQSVWFTNNTFLRRNLIGFFEVNNVIKDALVSGFNHVFLSRNFSLDFKETVKRDRVRYRVFIKYCVFYLKFCDFSELCCSAGVLPAWCVYTHWQREKTESGKYIKNTICN